MHFWAFIGSLLLASGVAMGAYGAHGLRAIVDVLFGHCAFLRFRYG